MQVSDHCNGKIFFNPVPTEVMRPGSFFRVLKKYLQKHPGREPKKPLGPFKLDTSLINNLPSQALRVTWLGHSSLILEVDGKRFLTDPVLCDRASPFKHIGPKRFFQNPLDTNNLPHIDYILLSHDHYDHLDKQAIITLTQKGIRVLTLLGVKKRLTDWGIKSELVSELDWWDTMLLDHDFKITVTPARHFSGRWISDRFTTLWGSFVIKGSKHSVFFGADSGYYNGFTTIAEKLGPFHLALLEIGAYNEEWADIHMGPESAVQAAIDLGRPLLMPVHWGTFSLAMHPWKEPVERLIAEAAKQNVQLVLPAPGETVAVNHQAYNSSWWVKYE
ncbi:MAG TPA: MBL fold metallo-hydrolase [Flavisolibacter sp.]|jgi:L-ascorbate metabolism protein UlaG (beta-lactamase superfamily)|nr:MBL fold metallo-hydrolase [Flavisolibacter sp.]